VSIFISALEGERKKHESVSAFAKLAPLRREKQTTRIVITDKEVFMLYYLNTLYIFVVIVYCRYKKYIMKNLLWRQTKGWT
jgi:hypothetical protein